MRVGKSLPALFLFFKTRLNMLLFRIFVFNFKFIIGYEAY